MPDDVEVLGPAGGGSGDILSPEALAFVVFLHREFDATRRRLLDGREAYQAELDAGADPSFDAGSAAVRDEPGWRVAPCPDDLLDRRGGGAGPPRPPHAVYP